MKTSYKDFKFKAREYYTANQSTVANTVGISIAGVGSTLAVVGAVKATTVSMHSLGVTNGVAKFAMVTAKASLLHKVVIATLGIGLAVFVGGLVWASLSPDKLTK